MTIIDKFFQKIINYFKPEIVYRDKIKKKLFKVLYIFFKKLIRGPFILNFGNFKLFAYSGYKDLSKFMLKNLEIWDGHYVLKINKLIKNKKSLFIDGGSSYGTYSIPIASINKNNCDVICFDASDKACKHLRENISLNKISNIEIFNVGIGEKERFESFNDNLNNLSNTGSYRFNTRDHRSNKVKIITLDNFFTKRDLNIYEKIIIKLDLEGYEFNAILGLVNTLKKFNLIIFFEFSRMLIRNPIFNPKKFNNFLSDNNFKITDFNNKIYSIEELLINLNQKNIKLDVLGEYLLINKNQFI